MIFYLYDAVRNIAVKRVHNLIGSFSGLSSSYVDCVCKHYLQPNQNRRSVMGLTSHLSCVYDAFSSYRVSFYLMMSLTMLGLVPGHLVHALFHSPL